MVEQRQEFQRELEAIEAKVTGLFAMVAEDLPRATYALVSGSGHVWLDYAAIGAIDVLAACADGCHIIIARG